MRRRLLGAMLLVALGAIVVLGVPLGFAGTVLVRNQAGTTLERQADVVASALEDEFETRRPISRRRLDLLTPSDRRVVVVDKVGRTSAAGRTWDGPSVRGTSLIIDGATVSVFAPAAEVDRQVRRVWLGVGLLSGAGIAMAAGLALWERRRLGRPLAGLAAVSRQLGAGDFSVRTAPTGLAELDEVGEALNSGAARIAELVARERQFSANASHQLRSPLTALRLHVEELGRVDDPELAAEVAEALAQVDRLSGIVDELLALARRGRAGDVSRIDLAALVESHARAWRARMEAARRRLEVRTVGEAFVEAAPGAVGQALDVLLHNALVHGAGTVRLGVGSDARRVVVVVSDEGPGVPAGREEAVFDRSVSGGAGSGIGLALARTLVESEGGRLQLVRGEAARFEIVLPVAPASR